MGTTLDLVYQYRQLTGRCNAGTGLDFDEIDTLTTAEALLASHPPLGEHDWNTVESEVAITALMRGPRLDDEVTVIHLGPSGCVCRHAPYADEGVMVELVIDERQHGVSYRFKARVLWLQDDDDDDFALGLEFVGVPVQVRYGPLAESMDTYAAA